MKRLILLTLTLVLILSGAVSAQDNEIEPVYRDFLEEIYRIIDGQPTGNLEVEKDYSVVIAWLTGQPASRNIGYTLKDVDGNGVRELLIGENWGESDDGTVLYDMYTVRDGKLLHVFSGWDRNRYYLCTNGNFLNKGSSGAMQEGARSHSPSVVTVRSLITMAISAVRGHFFSRHHLPTALMAAMSRRDSGKS